MLNEEVMYKALVEKDSSFEGLFFAGIKTTGIFCRPTCTARKPKKENVEYFTEAKDAVLHGYRPCKICRPGNVPGETPGFIAQLLDELNGDPQVKLKDWDLLQRGLDPKTIRRWFLKHYGITFHTYQRMIRISKAYYMIQEGKPITATAYDSGFESLSGFNETYKGMMGVPPSKGKTRPPVTITRLETPLGPMVAGATEQGVCLLEFTDRKGLETEMKVLSKKLQAPIIQGESPFFPQLKQELNEYFDRKRTQFTVPLHLLGTPFQESVWEELLRIPYGTTRSYKQQSLAVNNLKAIRAVAQANGMNKIAIMVPCHRVIGENGELTGYAGGLGRKKWLLELESGEMKLF